MMQQIKEFLLQPYPDRDDLKSIALSAFYTSALIFFILFAFRPFDIGRASNVFLLALQFGMITGAVTLIYELTLVHILNISREEPSWTFIKWIMSIMILMVFIAIANYVFMTVLVLHQPFYWSVLLIMLRGTLLIGVFPVVILGSFKMIRKLKQNLGIAASIQTSSADTSYSPSMHLPIQKSNATWTVKPSDILYIESQQNYVIITYTSDGEVKREMLRNTLSNIAEALSGTSIIRCHRSYLVNQNRIDKISGNAQGLKLFLTDSSDTVVPVSRKYIPVFKR
jgi:hypothetical protein